MLILVEKSEKKMIAVGLANAQAAHRNGWCHATVLAVPVLIGTSPAKILLYTRGVNRRSCPDMFDFAAQGHIDYNFELGPFDLEDLVLHNAIREAQEELRPDRPYEFRPGDFRRFGEYGEWTHTSSTNVEMSTMHFIRLPNDRIWWVGDSNQDFVQPETLSFPELMDRFKSAPEKFADGASRVLLRLSQDSQLRRDFEAVLAELAQI